MKISRTRGFLFLLIAILIHAIPYLFNAITGHGILNPDIQPPKIAIVFVYLLQFSGFAFFIAAIYVFVAGKSKELPETNFETAVSQDQVSERGRKQSLWFFIAEFVGFFILLVIANLLKPTDLFLVIFLAVTYGTRIFGIIGLIVAIRNFKKTSVVISFGLIILSLLYISGYSFNLAAGLGRELSGEAKRDREALIEHELRNIESDQNQADYMEVQDDLDTVMRAWHKKYQEYFSQPKTYSGYLYDGLGDKSKLEPFPSLYGVERVDLACPKCYTEEWGEHQGKRDLYEAYLAILNPLLNKPVQVTLPDYEVFKGVMEQQIKDLLDQKGFYVRGTNSYGIPIVLPEHEQPLSYYMDPFKLFPGVSYGVPTIIYYQERNINEELKAAASSLK